MAVVTPTLSWTQTDHQTGRALPATPCRPPGQGWLVLAPLLASSRGEHVFKAASHASPGSRGPPPKRPLHLNADPRVEADTQGPALPVVMPTQNDQDTSPSLGQLKAAVESVRKQQKREEPRSRLPTAALAGRELLVPACTSKTLAGHGKVRGAHGCSSWPPGCAAGPEATSIWGGRRALLLLPTRPEEPPAACTLHLRVGCCGQAGLLGASELLVQSPGCKRGGAVASAPAPRGWQCSLGSGRELGYCYFSSHQDSGPRSPPWHPFNSNPMPRSR